jgi:biotin transport system substrate-specific component
MTAAATNLRNPSFATAVAGNGTAARLSLLVAGVLLLTLSAKMQIPWQPVPMTMQTYVILVVAMSYGTRLAVATIVAYLAVGALGAPVFAGTPEKGIGLAYMLGPTGGYLAGFVAAATVCGKLAESGWDRRWWTSIAAMSIGHALIFTFGVGWLAMLFGFERALAVGLMPFLSATVVKTVLAAATLPLAWKAMRALDKT